jgi:hypothetical protein
VSAVRDGVRSLLEPRIREELDSERAVLVALGAPDSLPAVDRRVDVEVLPGLYEHVCRIVVDAAGDVDQLWAVTAAEVLPVRRRALYAFAAPAIVEAGRLPVDDRVEGAVEAHYGHRPFEHIAASSLLAALGDGPLCSSNPQEVLERQIVPALWPEALPELAANA